MVSLSTDLKLIEPFHHSTRRLSRSLKLGSGKNGQWRACKYHFRLEFLEGIQEGKRGGVVRNVFVEGNWGLTVTVACGSHVVVVVVIVAVHLFSYSHGIARNLESEYFLTFLHFFSQSVTFSHHMPNITKEDRRWLSSQVAQLCKLPAANLRAESQCHIKLTFSITPTRVWQLSQKFDREFFQDLCPN